MKKILVVLLIVGCSSEEGNAPTFRIEGAYFESRFDNFANIAKGLGVTIPHNNLILRPVDDGVININDSKSYRKDGQLYVDIDNKFIEANASDDSDGIRVIYQQLANGLLSIPFRDCGIMKKVENGDDLTGEDWDYGDWPNLFDSSSPCL